MSTINNRKDDTIISGTSDADSIYNAGAKVSINAGAGNDSVDNHADSVTVDGNSNNDFIINGGYWENERGGKKVSILGGKGNDTITSHGNNSVLNGGSGNDLIYNGYRYYAPWDAFYDSDNDNFSGAKVSIDSGTGNDTIKNNGAKVSINAGAGNDSVDNHADSVTVDGNSNNDFIINGGYWENERGGKKVSILGGKGNDTITSHGNNSVLNGGSGNDLIYNGYRYYAPWDAFYDSDNDNFSGNNTTIFGGSGNDTIKNNGVKVSINAGAGNDSIENSGNNVTIDSGTGNDTINNNGVKVSINAGAGNDSIENSGNNVTIDSGTGNDTINNNGENVLVKIGGGKNTVKGNVTVNMGTGNSTLTGDRSVQIYQYIGGDNLITNYSGEDIIHITSGKINSYSFDGGDLIFHIGNGSLRLKNMTNHAITVKDSKGKTSTKIYGTGYSGHEVIKKFVQSMFNSKLSTKQKMDEAVKACSNFSSIQDVIDHIISDRKKSKDADSFLQDYCGLFLNNADTGAVTGWDAGGLYVKTKDDLLPKNGNASYPTSTIFTKRGLTLTVPEKNTLTQQEQLVIRGLYSWWLEDVIKLIEESYGLKFTDKPLSINFSFRYEPNESYWGLGGPEVILNMAYTTLDASEKSGNGLDGLFAHEFTHVMEYNFDSFDIDFLVEPLAGITAGWDIDGKNELRDIVLTPAKLAEAFNSNNTVVGTIFLRYLMKQASDSYDSTKNYAWKANSSISGTSKADFLTGNAKGVVISAGKGNDTITAYGKNMKVFGSKGNDYILVGSIAGGASIDGGTGNDSIENSGAKVSIDAGTGNDSIENSGAKVSIDAGTGNDSVDNSGAKVSIDAGTGNDSVDNHADSVTVNGGDGNDYVLNDGGKKVKIFGGEGADTIRNETKEEYNFELRKWEVVSSPDNSTINAGAGNDSVDNHADSVTVDGGADNDFIINGGYWEDERGGKKVSILGGKGNDTITSHGNNSVLNGGSGNDLIYNGYRYYAPWDAFYDSDNDNFSGNNTTIFGGSGNDTIKNNGVKVSINAGAGNDCIIGGKGDETLFGGSGNDSLWGNAGADKFFYAVGDGNDVIFGFDNKDVLTLDGLDFTASYKNNSLTFKVSGGSVTLKEFTATTFSVNGDVYKISGKKLAVS